MNTPQSPFDRLEPAIVWRHFATLCRIPRASKQEARLRDELCRWAGERGLPTQVDAAGNLLITRPASRDGADLPAIALQAHLDMVCQHDSTVVHDWSRDEVRAEVADGWLVAKQTTLGADNGIGVALVLAALEDETLVHGPIEALLTVDEEAGMGGARGLAAGALQARRMLNLDTEDWGEFYLGCAGGLDVDVERGGRPEALPAGHLALRIAVSGLRGGHSGVDIHEERGNAIKLLARVLRELAAALPLRLVSLCGGTARNALPREAEAIVALPEPLAPQLAAAVAEWEARLRSALAGIETSLRLVCSPASVEQAMAPAEQSFWLNALNAAPHGVWRMSQHVPGVVETSNNLGIVRLDPQQGHCNFMVRSLREDGAQALAGEIASLFALAGQAVHVSGEYPGWEPAPASNLLKTCQTVFMREFGGEKAALKVIHAGLECGLIGAKHPGLDIVSLGPTIRGAHAPGEAVEIDSVGKVWRLLRAILAEPA